MGLPRGNAAAKMKVGNECGISNIENWGHGRERKVSPYRGATQVKERMPGPVKADEAEGWGCALLTPGTSARGGRGVKGSAAGRR